MIQSLEISEFFVGLRKDGRLQWLSPTVHSTEDSARSVCEAQNKLTRSSSCEYVVVESKRNVEFEVVE